MKETCTTADVCRIADTTPVALRVRRSRLKQKGIDLMPEGEGWTRYSFKDAIRIVAFSKMADVLNASLENAAIAVQRIHSFKDDKAFLVLTGAPIKLGGMRLPDGSVPEATLPDVLTSKVVRGRDLATALDKAGSDAVLVLNLDAVEEAVEAGWPK